jgi:hypothetical protein
MNGHVDVLQLLIQHGADVHADPLPVPAHLACGLLSRR